MKKQYVSEGSSLCLRQYTCYFGDRTLAHHAAKAWSLRLGYEEMTKLKEVAERSYIFLNYDRFARMIVRAL